MASMKRLKFVIKNLPWDCWSEICSFIDKYATWKSLSRVNKELHTQIGCGRILCENVEFFLKEVPKKEKRSVRKVFIPRKFLVPRRKKSAPAWNNEKVVGQHHLELRINLQSDVFRKMPNLRELNIGGNSGFHKKTAGQFYFHVPGVFSDFFSDDYDTISFEEDGRLLFNKGTYCEDFMDYSLLLYPLIIHGNSADLLRVINCFYDNGDLNISNFGNLGELYVMGGAIGKYSHSEWKPREHDICRLTLFNLPRLSKLKAVKFVIELDRCIAEKIEKLIVNQCTIAKYCDGLSNLQDFEFSHERWGKSSSFFPQILKNGSMKTLSITNENEVYHQELALLRNMKKWDYSVEKSFWEAYRLERHILVPFSVLPPHIKDLSTLNLVGCTCKEVNIHDLQNLKHVTVMNSEGKFIFDKLVSLESFYSKYCDGVVIKKSCCNPSLRYMCLNYENLENMDYDFIDVLMSLDNLKTFKMHSFKSYEPINLRANVFSSNSLEFLSVNFCKLDDYFDHSEWEDDEEQPTPTLGEIISRRISPLSVVNMVNLWSLRISSTEFNFTTLPNLLHIRLLFSIKEHYSEEEIRLINKNIHELRNLIVFDLTIVENKCKEKKESNLVLKFVKMKNLREIKIRKKWHVGERPIKEVHVRKNRNLQTLKIEKLVVAKVVKTANPNLSDEESASE